MQMTHEKSRKNTAKWKKKHYEALKVSKIEEFHMRQASAYVHTTWYDQ